MTTHPSPSEYLVGARRAAANSWALCRAARHLEKSGFNGPATTLLATALEEATKAGVLVLLAEDGAALPGSHAELLNALFRDHRTKYRLAAWATGAFAAGASSPEVSTPDLPRDLLIGLGIVALLLVLALALRSGDPPPESPKLEFDAASFLAGLARDDPEFDPGWIAKAFERRNAGLYVAFKDGEWRSPSDVSTEDVAEARRVVIPLVRGAQRWARSGTAEWRLGQA